MSNNLSQRPSIICSSRSIPGERLAGRLEKALGVGYTINDQTTDDWKVRVCGLQGQTKAALMKIVLTAYTSFQCGAEDIDFNLTPPINNHDER